MKNEELLNENLVQEVKDVNEQFTEFLKTKGISAKFKLALSNMKESAKAQHEQDKANLEAVKKQSAEENKEFVEFLHTKGLKAKVKLIVENIKKGAKESKEKTKEQIAKSMELANPYKVVTAQDLNKEFNEFLRQKGLSGKYTVTIEETKE